MTDNKFNIDVSLVFLHKEIIILKEMNVSIKNNFDRIFMIIQNLENYQHGCNDFMEKTEKELKDLSIDDAVKSIALILGRIEKIENFLKQQIDSPKVDCSLLNEKIKQMESQEIMIKELQKQIILNKNGHYTRPHKCPACNGAGSTDSSLNDSITRLMENKGQVTAVYNCKPCKGEGILWR